jgi:hypothetical protein
MKITYLSGNDVREPVDQGQTNIILHCCNDINLMGSGVARALFQKWPDVKSKYHYAFEQNKNNKLGDVHYVKVEASIYVGNIIGQHTIDTNEDGGPPIRYWAIDKAFQKVVQSIHKRDEEVIVNLPYLMGCDLARGRWEEIEYLINKNFIESAIEVYVYDLLRKRG